MGVKSYTLVELIAVVLIVALLVFLAFATYLNVVEKSRGAQAIPILYGIYRNIKVYRLQEDKSISGWGTTWSWQDIYLKEPQSEYFHFHFNEASNCIEAVRKGDPNKWIRLYLENGIVEKTAPY